MCAHGFQNFCENGKFLLTFYKNPYSKSLGSKVAILSLKKSEKATSDVYILVDFSASSKEYTSLIS